MALDSPPTGMWVLLAIAATVAVLAHLQLRRYVLALAVSAFATPIIFFVASSIHSGIPGSPYVAPFLAYAAVALVISAAIGAGIIGFRWIFLRGA